MTEARKYGLCLTVAHQYMGQLIPKVQAAVLGNIGTIIIFRVGGEDAVKLKPEMAPVFDIKDMINLATQEFYIKMTIDGETYDPFSADTLKVMPPAHPSYHDRIIEQSHQNYTITADAAKQLIAEEEASIIRTAQEKSIIEGGKAKEKEVSASNSAVAQSGTSNEHPRPELGSKAQSNSDQNASESEPLI